MSKSIKVIRELAGTPPTPKKDPADVQDRQRQKSQTDKLANKKALGAVPKNNNSVFSPKPEPNRGLGADRHPNVPRAKVTRPTMEDWKPHTMSAGKEKFYNEHPDKYKEDRNKKLTKWYLKQKTKPTTEGRESEYAANSQLSASKKKAPGHYLMRNGQSLHKEPHPTAQAALKAYNNLPDKTSVKIQHVKEEVAVNSIGGGGVSTLTNPSDNYSAQVDTYRKKHLKQIKTKMARRKLPVGESYTPGVAYDKTIYVMRHGKTALDAMKRSDGWLDFPLTDEGRLGLIKAQQYLKNVPLTCIYAASLKRTKETGEIIASGVLSNPSVEIADELKTWNLGNMMGTVKKPNKPIVKFYMSNPDEKPVGGESMSEFRKRFLPWLENLKEEVKEGSGPVLVVVSGTNLREISQSLYGDVEVLNLDEGGLLCLQPSGDSWHSQVIFGHKDDEEDYSS
jgi:broad specificity phosphatase PhoE